MVTITIFMVTVTTVGVKVVLAVHMCEALDFIPMSSFRPSETLHGTDQEPHHTGPVTLRPQK